MRTFQSITKNAWLFIGICLLFLGSCKKNVADTIPAIHNTDEYLRYAINGSGYGFEMPIDQVMTDTFQENQTFDPRSTVFAQRIPLITTDFARIDYGKQNIAPGSQQKLGVFSVPQMEVYPYQANSTNPVMINITEYGTIGEYIAGNFTAVFIGSAPGNLTYSVTCQFRVKRRI